MLLPGARLELHNLTLLLPGVTPEARAAAPASVLAHVLGFGYGVSNSTGSGGGGDNNTSSGGSDGSPTVLLSGVSLVLASDADHGAFLRALCEPLAWRYSGAGELQVIDGVAVYGDSTMQLLPPPPPSEAGAAYAVASPLARLVSTRVGVAGTVPPPWVCSATHVSDAAALLSTARGLLANTSYAVLLSLAGNVTLEPDSWGAGVAVPRNRYLGLYGDLAPGRAVQMDFGGKIAAIDIGPKQGGFLVIQDLALLGLPYPGEVAVTKDLVAAWLHAVLVDKLVYFLPGGKARPQLRCVRCTLVLPELELAWWRTAAAAAQAANGSGLGTSLLDSRWRLTVEGAAAVDGGADSPPPAPTTDQAVTPSPLPPLRVSLVDNSVAPRVWLSQCTFVSLGSSGAVASPRATAAAAVWPFGAKHSLEEAVQVGRLGFSMRRDMEEAYMSCTPDQFATAMVPSRWPVVTLNQPDWLRPGGRDLHNSLVYVDPLQQPWTAPEDWPCTVRGPPSSQASWQTLWDARGFAARRTLPPGSPLTLEELVLYNLPPAGPDMEGIQGPPPPILQPPATPPAYRTLTSEKAPPGVTRRADIEGAPPPKHWADSPPPASAGPPSDPPPATTGPLSRLALPLWNFQMNRSAEPPLLLLRRVTLVVPPAELNLLLRVLAATGVLPRAPPPPQPQPVTGPAPPQVAAAAGSQDGLLGRRLLPSWEASVSDLAPAAGAPGAREGEGARGEEQQPAERGARVLRRAQDASQSRVAAAVEATGVSGADCPLAALRRFAASADVVWHNDTSIVFRAVSFHGWDGRDVTVTSDFPPDAPTRRLITDAADSEYEELLAECPLGPPAAKVPPPAPPSNNDTAPQPATQPPPPPSAPAGSGAGSVPGSSKQRSPPPAPGPAWLGATAASGTGGRPSLNVVAIAVAVPVGVTVLALLLVVTGVVLLLVRRRRVPPPRAAPPAKLHQSEEQEQPPQQQAGQGVDGTAAGSIGDGSSGGGGGVAAPSCCLGAAAASESAKEELSAANSADDMCSPTAALAPLVCADGSNTSGVRQRPEPPTSDPRFGVTAAAAAQPGTGSIAILGTDRTGGTSGDDGAKQAFCVPQTPHPPAQGSPVPAQLPVPQTPLLSRSVQQPGHAAAAAWPSAPRLAAAAPALPNVAGDGLASSSLLGLGQALLGPGRPPLGLGMSSLLSYFTVREAGLTGAEGGEGARRVVHLSPGYRCRSGEPSEWGGTPSTLLRVIQRWRDALEQEGGCAGEGAVQLLQAIGRGSYGVVYLGVWRGLVVATKVLVVQNTLWGAEGRARQRAILEAAVGASLDHPNVVATYAYDVMPMEVEGEGGPSGAGVWDSGSGRDPWVSGGRAAAPGQYDVHQLRILQEFCEGGSLKDALESRAALGGGVLAGGAAAMTALLLALDIACGLRHVHAAGIVHGDISSANVLLRRRSRQDGSRHDGSRHDGSRHDGSRHDGSRHDGSRHEGSRHSRPSAQQLWSHAVRQPPLDAQAGEGGSSAGNPAAGANTAVASGSVAPALVEGAKGAAGGQPVEVEGEEGRGGGAEQGTGEYDDDEGGHGHDAPPGVDASEAAWRARAARARGLWRRRCPALAAADVVAKVADFGLSVRLLGSQTHASGLRQGTPVYVAPEVQGAGRVSRNSDVYSFGVLLLELAHGATAPAIWAAATAEPLHREVLRHARGAAASPIVAVMLDSLPQPRDGGEFGGGDEAVGAAVGVVGGGYCPAGLRELATACLATDPAGRPTLEQVAEALVNCIEAVGADLEKRQVDDLDRQEIAQMQDRGARPPEAVGGPGWRADS